MTLPSRSALPSGLPHRALVATLALLAAAPVAVQAMDGVQVHGFASQGYLLTTQNNLDGRTTEGGTFEFNEFALNVTATPVDRVRIGLQVIAYDYVDYGNDKPQIDWAYGEYQVPTGSDEVRLSVVAGRFKTGLGFYNDYRDLDITRTSVFLPPGGYAAVFRDFYIAANGAQANLSLGLGKAGSLDLSGYYGGQNVPADEGPIARGYAFTPTAKIDDIDVHHVDGAYAQWNTPVDGLRAKISVIDGTDMLGRGTLDAADFNSSGAPVVLNIPTGTRIPYTLDLSTFYTLMSGLEYQTGDWTFAAEGAMAYYSAQVDMVLPATTATIPGLGTFPVAATPLHTQSYSRKMSGYASVNYQLSALPAPFNRLQVFAAYNAQHEKYGKDDDTLNNQNGVQVAVRYDVAQHFLVKAEFQRNHGVLGLPTANNPDGFSAYWNQFALKTTFDF